MRLLVRLLALVGLAFLGLTFYGRERAWERVGPADLGRVEFDALVRSSTPNDALAATPALASTLSSPADIVLPLYDASPEEVMAAVDAVVAREGGRVVETRPMLRRVVTRSPLMRFPDTNTIEAVPVDGGTALRAYARATVGQSDFGANGKRLEAWLGALPLPRVAMPPATAR